MMLVFGHVQENTFYLNQESLPGFVQQYMLILVSGMEIIIPTMLIHWSVIDK